MEGLKFNQKFRKILSIAVKNFFAFLIGGVSGAAAALLLIEPLLKYSIKKDVGLGIIAVAPFLIIFYLILFGVAGGALGIIVYNLIKFFKRKK